MSLFQLTLLGLILTWACLYGHQRLTEYFHLEAVVADELWKQADPAIVILADEIAWEHELEGRPPH